MNKSLSPKATVAAIGALVVILSAGAVWIWRAPSVSGIKPVSRAEVNAAMREAHNGPTPEQLEQIKEWKKTHPGAYTRF